MELNQRANQRGEYYGLHLVMIRVHEKGKKPVRYSTDVYIEKKNYNQPARYGKWVKSDDLANQKIEARIAWVKQEHGKLTTGPVTYKEAATEFLKRYKEQEATYVLYDTSFRMFIEYIGEDFKLVNITQEKIDGYVSHLKAKKNTGSTIKLRLSNAKQPLKITQHRDKEYYFENQKIKAEKTKKEACTEAEIKILETAELNDVKREVVDAFLWCLYCLGMRIGDAIRMKTNWVENGVLEYISHKSKDHFSIKLTDKAVKIYEKYAGKNGKYLFSFRPNEKFKTNEFITVRRANTELGRKMKTIFKSLGVNSKVTPHGSRHTFVRKAKKAGVDMEIIQNAVGHEDPKMTKNYTDEFDNDLINEMNKKLFE